MVVDLWWLTHKSEWHLDATEGPNICDEAAAVKDSQLAMQTSGLVIRGSVKVLSVSVLDLRDLVN